MEKTKITQEMRIKLREGFPDEAYSVHITKSFLTTLKAMYVTERLNDVFGIGRWSIEHEIVERAENYVLVKGKFVSLDYDVIVPDQYGGHRTEGVNVEIADGYKSAVTDCQSKIASYLEIGIDMFKGKVKLSGTGGTKLPKQEVIERELKTTDIEKWNGKIYTGGHVFIDNVKIKVSEDQLNRLKLLPKYIKDGSK